MGIIDAMVPLGSMTLTSGQTTVTLNSIPQGFKDLRLVVSYAMSGTSSASRLRFNGDTGANYNSVGMGGQGSSAGSWSEANVTGGRVIGYAIGPTTGQQTFFLDVIDYSATDKHKTSLSRMNDAASDVMATATRWASTAAVTSVTIYDVLGQTFVTGSTFNLFGIRG